MKPAVRTYPLSKLSPNKAVFQLLCGIAPDFAARLVQRRVFTPRRARIREEESMVLIGGREFELAVAHHKVGGWSWGEGPSMVLVHGWGGHAAHMTAFVSPLVAAGYRVVALDMPGHGSSSVGRSSIVHFAAALKELNLRIGPTHGLIAHSLGAAASLYAIALGMSVRRAVFFAPPARFEPMWERVQREYGIPSNIWNRVMRETERWLELDFASLSPLSLATRIKVPSLIVHDESDGEIPFEDGQEVARSMGAASFHKTSGLGHLRILKDRRAVATAVSFVTDSYPSTIPEVAAER